MMGLLIPKILILLLVMLTLERASAQSCPNCPFSCVQWKCKLCEANAISPPCSKILSECAQCDWIYGVLPGVIATFRNNRLQKGITWWGPEFYIKFDITVKLDGTLPRPVNVFQITEMVSGYPKEDSKLPGVFVIPRGEQRIAIEVSYLEGYIHFDYEIDQKYNVLIIQTEKEATLPTGPGCWSWPKSYTLNVYVQGGEFVELTNIAERVIEGKAVEGVGEQMVRYDYDCNNLTELAPPCPRIPWKEVAIYASNPWQDSICCYWDVAKFENFEVFSHQDQDLPPDEIRCKKPFPCENCSSFCPCRKKAKNNVIRNESLTLPSGIKKGKMDNHFSKISLKDYLKSIEL